MAEFVKTGKTVSDIIGENGWIEFNRLNLAREDKGVQVFLMQASEDNEDGILERTCLLGTDLSKRFRSKKVTAGMLLGLEVGINEIDVHYIIEKEVARIKVKQDKMVKAEIKYEEVKWQDYVAL